MELAMIAAAIVLVALFIDWLVGESDDQRVKREVREAMRQAEAVIQRAKRRMDTAAGPRDSLGSWKDW